MLRFIILHQNHLTFKDMQAKLETLGISDEESLSIFKKKNLPNLNPQIQLDINGLLAKSKKPKGKIFEDSNRPSSPWKKNLKEKIQKNEDFNTLDDYLKYGLKGQPYSQSKMSTDRDRSFNRSPQRKIFSKNRIPEKNSDQQDSNKKRGLHFYDDGGNRLPTDPDVTVNLWDKFNNNNTGQKDSLITKSLHFWDDDESNMSSIKKHPNKSILKKIVDTIEEEDYDHENSGFDTPRKKVYFEDSVNKRTPKRKNFMESNNSSEYNSPGRQIRSEIDDILEQQKKQRERYLGLIEQAQNAHQIDNYSPVRGNMYKSPQRSPGRYGSSPKRSNRKSSGGKNNILDQFQYSDVKDNFEDPWGEWERPGSKPEESQDNFVPNRKKRIQEKTLNYLRNPTKQTERSREIIDLAKKNLEDFDGNNSISGKQNIERLASIISNEIKYEIPDIENSRDEEVMKYTVEKYLEDYKNRRNKNTGRRSGSIRKIVDNMNTVDRLSLARDIRVALGSNRRSLSRDSLGSLKKSRKSNNSRKSMGSLNSSFLI